MTSASNLRWHTDPLESIHWCFCPDRESWDEARGTILTEHHLDVKEYPHLDAGNGGMCTIYRDPDTRVIVTLDERLDDDTPRMIEMIAHESFHVACRILDAMTESDPGEETVARLTGMIARGLMIDYIESGRRK